MSDDTDASDTGSDGDHDSDRDQTLQDAVGEFLDRTDAALAEYDKGYADADATLRVVRNHLADLRATAEE